MPDAPTAPRPAASPEPSSWPVPSSPAGPRRSRAVRATAVIALLGVLVALAGAALAALPLRTPTQDCGTALTFLLDGRMNQFVDPASPPAGTTRAEAEANNAEPCQERAANRARPAGALLVGGTLVALVALAVEVVVRLSAHRRPPAAVPPWGAPRP